MRGLVIPVLALVAMAGQAQTFTPIVEDSIDFVITGTTTSSHDSVAWFKVAPFGGGTMKVLLTGGQFRVTDRLPRHTFIQIGDNAGNDLRFIVEETPTDINLVTGEVSGSDLQQRFIRCQMRERDIDRVAEPWWDSLIDEEKDRIIIMREEGLPDASAKDSANYLKYEDLRATAMHSSAKTSARTKTTSSQHIISLCITPNSTMSKGESS